MLAKSTDKEDV